MTLPPLPAQVRTRNAVARALQPSFEARTWPETLYRLLNLPVGIVTFAVVVTGLATGLGLLITLLGIPIIFATMYLSRGMGAVERVRARALPRADVPAPCRADPPRDTWWRQHVGPMRRRGPIVAVALAVSLAATACSAVIGSGNVVMRQIPVTSFSKLEVSGSFTAAISVGTSEVLTVRVDDNLVDSLDVGVSGDTLHIGLKSGTSVTNATLEADVTVRSLQALKGSGSSTITLSDTLAADALSLTISGASRLSGPIEIEGGGIDLSGASEAELSGSATTLQIDESGASRLDAKQLTIDHLTIDLSGASDADVSVTGSLSASASGESTLRYAGSPAILRSETSGASAIQPLT